MLMKIMTIVTMSMVTIPIKTNDGHAMHRTLAGHLGTRRYAPQPQHLRRKRVQRCSSYNLNSMKFVEDLDSDANHS